MDVLYHEQTNSTWVSDLNWRKYLLSGTVLVGEIEHDTDNIFDIGDTLKKHGYYLVNTEEFFKLTNF
ncbi:hypothetical protein [Priestia megaterium]|uniref:hypothetical protein n=1 Tax=Priestia megaterium TaxID=1404 RepID=UPI003CC66F62